MHFVTTLGDIAHAYEESVQALKDLAKNLPTDEDEGYGIGEHAGHLNDAAQRLAIWSKEHNVVTGSLDHALRESSRLKQRVIELLDNLSAVKWPQSASGTENSSEDSMGLANFGPVELPHEVETPLEPKTRSMSFDGLAYMICSRRNSDDNSIGIDTTISLDSSVHSNPARETIDYVHKLIKLLFEMGPSLRSPAASDRLNINSDPIAALPDIQHVETNFRNARKELQQQLGFANWERRQCLIKLRERRMKALEQAANLNNPYQDMIKRTASQLLQTRKNTNKQREGSDETAMGVLTAPEHSLATLSMTQATSAPEFDFSKNDAQSTFMTEVTNELALESPGPKVDGYIHAPRTLKIPRPPSPNEDFNGAAFQCPYCMSKIENLVDMEEWTEHIYLDLRPYMCTYEACSRPRRTYPSRRSWWAHERTDHRIKRVWECNPCQTENRTFRFHTIEDFEEHTKQHHTLLASTIERRSIAQFCEKQTKVLPPPKECPLCRGPTMILSEADGEEDVDIDKQEKDVQAHIADHFEQLALYVALPTGNLPSDRGIDDFIDDSDSDDDRKEDIKSLASVEDRQVAKYVVREKNVERYFKDQDAQETFNMHFTQLEKSDRPKVNALSARQHEEKRIATERSRNKLNMKWPLNTVRQPRNEFFTGKEDVLKEMSFSLRRKGRVYVLSGLGGVGKTLTAVEFSYRFQDEFECIFWLQADTSEGLAQSFVEINIAVGLEVEGDNQKRDIEHGRDWLGKTERRWLLIFDNAESWDVISTYIPYQFPTSQGSILITTQNDRIRTMDRDMKLQKLHVLEPEDGADMLLSYLRRSSNDAEQRELAKEISSFVGGLPIAIAHVAGYADYSDYTLEDLLEIFREWRKVVGVATDEADDLPASFRQDAFSYDDTLAMVYNVTLRELNADAQNLMNILAYLNCDAVPETMIWNMHEEPSLRFLDSREKFRAKSTKRALVSRRLVQYREVNGEMCFSVHRALQRSIRSTLSSDPEKQQQVFSQAVSLLRDVYPESSPIQQPKPEKWFEFQRLLPHLNSLREVYLSRQPKVNGSLELARILSDAGMNQWERGMTREGLMLLRTSEGVLDALQFDANDTSRADIHIIVALMYDNTGVSSRQEAMNRRLKALEIRETEMYTKKSSAYHDNEVLLYNARMDYAISLLQFHDYRQAEPIIEECLKKYQQWGPAEDLPYEYAKYYNKMALVRLYQRRFDEAIDLARQGVNWMGQTQNFSLRSRFDFDLACILLQSGKVEQSRQLHQRIFDARVEKLGQSSELTLHSRFAIGAISEMKGQYEDAEYWFNRALSLHRAAAWSEEAVARTKYHLARTQEALGRVEEARVLYDDARQTLCTLTENTEGAWTGLKPGADENILFDHILTICGARFTGLGLLDHIV